MQLDAQATPIRLLGAHVDITARKQAEEKVVRLNRVYGWCPYAQ